MAQVPTIRHPNVFITGVNAVIVGILIVVGVLVFSAIGIVLVAWDLIFPFEKEPPRTVPVELVDDEPVVEAAD